MSFLFVRDQNCVGKRKKKKNKTERESGLVSEAHSQSVNQSANKLGSIIGGHGVVYVSCTAVVLSWIHTHVYAY